MASDYDRACGFVDFQILQKLISEETLRSIFQDAQGKKTIKDMGDLANFVGGTAASATPGLVSKKQIASILAYTKAIGEGQEALVAIINFGFNDDPVEAGDVLKYLVSKGVKNLERVEGLESLGDVLKGALPGYQSTLKAVLLPFIKVPPPPGRDSNANIAKNEHKGDEMEIETILAWRSKRCDGFVPKEAWDFIPSEVPTRAVRSSLSRDGFPFDNAYFSVWRGYKADLILRNCMAKKTAIFRSPPYSGKTAMLQAMAIHASKTTQIKVFPISCTPLLSMSAMNENKPLAVVFDMFWENETGYTLMEWQKIASECGATLLLDEIQVLYDIQQMHKYKEEPTSDGKPNDVMERIFWSLLRVWPTKGGITVVAAAVYSATIVVKAVSGHIQWGEQYFIGDMRLNNTEMESMFARFNQCNQASPNLLTKSAAVWMGENTLGHVGFLRELLDGLEDYAKINFSTHQAKTAARYLASREALAKVQGSRGYSKPGDWDDTMRTVCQILLTVGPVANFEKARAIFQSNGVQDMNAAVAKGVYPLLKVGVLTLVDGATIEFSSNIIHYLCAQDLLQGPIAQAATTIDLLVVAIIRKLHSNTLKKAFEFVVMSDRHLGEPIWRSELQRAALLCVDKYSLLPEVGHIVQGLVDPNTGKSVKIDGLVDFYITDKFWALEVMREGYGITEHIDRFEPSGVYADLPVADYRVIDFRHESKAVRKRDEHLLTVMYNDAFTQFSISGGRLPSEVTVSCDLTSISSNVARGWWSVNWPLWWR